MAGGGSTTESHSLCTVVFQKMLIYDRIQEKIRSFTRINAPYTVSVSRRISSLFGHGQIRSHFLRRNTVVYGAYMACMRSYTTPYTESITVDLGNAI